MIVVINVAAGGMRSITFVQAFQYWLKLTALATPIFVILIAWRSGDHPVGVLESLHGAGAEWAEPLSQAGGRDHPLYATYSLLLALCFGTMGLPHVLVRFYTNPDGRAARRTTVVVLALLGAVLPVPTPVRRPRTVVRARPGRRRRRTPSYSSCPAGFSLARRETCSARWSQPERSPRSCRPRPA